MFCSLGWLYSSIKFLVLKKKIVSKLIDEKGCRSRELTDVACTLFPDICCGFSIYFQVPLLAAGLMQICEVFGSCVPDVSWTLTTGEKLSHREVFSNAFTLLLRFWRFDLLPVQQLRINAATPPFGSLFSPECLLLVRNCKLASFGRSAKDRQRLKRLSKIVHFPTESVFVDSFPKFNFWYRQHQECIASIRSGLVPGEPVHQIVDALLSMMFRKVNDGAEPSTPVAMGSSNSSGSALDDALMKLKVPAWDILKAIPFVLDASLTACAYGRLSTRELATGLPCSLFAYIIFNFNLLCTIESTKLLLK